MTLHRSATRVLSRALVALTASALVAAAPALADEPCQSPYMAKIVGQEDYVYVWTLGDPALGAQSDSLVTIDANPASATYGKVLSRAEVGSINEAHHGGLTDDRARLWLGGLDSSRIFVFDVATDPAKPKLVRTIDNTTEVTGGLAGPHTFIALPGRMLVAFLSSKDGSGKTGMAEFTNDGRYVRTIWMPADAPYGYDARPSAKLNRLLTSSFTGKNVYMTELPKVLATPELMKQFGDSMIVWNLHTMKPLQTFRVGGAPLEIRWASSPENDWAVSTTALDHKMVLVKRKPDGTFEAKTVADVGEILPVDLSLSADDKHLYVTGFMTGELKHYDMSDPEKPVLVETINLGPQANMVSQSWDGKRIYVTGSLLSKWDKPDAKWWMKKFTLGPDGKLAEEKGFEVDFSKLGRPHQMNFGSKALYGEAGGVDRVASLGAPASAAR
ncbi:MAG TPA: selenium-binding protein SBP56-related protein [Candidatus Binatia bacterium]|nr:selenium-binding protein SBP56-related protein [Candidatus Binatia bacterium]